MNESELKQDAIEDFILNYKNYQYQQSNLNETFEATIIHIMATGIVVYIEKFDSKFTIHISKLSKDKLEFNPYKKELFISNSNSNSGITCYKVFDKIKVTISKVDYDFIDIILAE